MVRISSAARVVGALLLAGLGLDGWAAAASAQGALGLGDPRGASSAVSQAATVQVAPEAAPAVDGSMPSAPAPDAAPAPAAEADADARPDAPSALAADAPPAEQGVRDVYLELQAFTHLPLFLGGMMSMEMGRHFVIRAGGGVVPGPYLDAINEIGTGWSIWSDGDASVLRSLLSDAMFLEGGVALRTDGPTGLEISASYALLWAHTIVSDETMMNMGAPPGFSSSPIGLDIFVHAVHVELAGVFLLGDPFPIRLAVGWMHSLGRGANFVYDDSDPALNAMLPAAAAAMEARIDSVGFGPTLSLSMGLRL